MQRRRRQYPLGYRRARSLVVVIALFWLWLWFGGAATLGLLHGSPIHEVLAVYGLAVVVLVSIPAALLAVATLVLTHPRATVVRLPATTASQAGARRLDEKAS